MLTLKASKPTKKLTFLDPSLACDDVAQGYLILPQKQTSTMQRKCRTSLDTYHRKMCTDPHSRLFTKTTWQACHRARAKTESPRTSLRGDGRPVP